MDLLHRIQGVLGRHGYRFQRISPLDLRLSEKSPPELVFQHSKNLFRSLLVEVPLARCRSSLGVAPDERHAFVSTLIDGVPNTYEGSKLECYYRHCRPSTAAEVLGISPSDAPGFSQISPLSYLMPWYGGQPLEILARREIRMVEEAAEFGFDLANSDGLTHFGPVSPEKGALEIRRLGKLYRSMKEQGFIRSDAERGDVSGALLTDSTGAWCVYVGYGQHRIAVAAALGLKFIPIRIGSPAVKREEVMYWHQVLEKRITPDGALAVFDRVMSGEPPPSCRLPSTD